MMIAITAILHSNSQISWYIFLNQEDRPHWISFILLPLAKVSWWDNTCFTAMVLKLLLKVFSRICRGPLWHLDLITSFNHSTTANDLESSYMTCFQTSLVFPHSPISNVTKKLIKPLLCSGTYWRWLNEFFPKISAAESLAVCKWGLKTYFLLKYLK